MKVGDKINITIDDVLNYYTILDVLSPTAILVENLGKNLRNLPPIYLSKDDNGVWKIPHYNVYHLVDVSGAGGTLGKLFTLPYRDVGKNILLQLPEEDLDKICNPKEFNEASKLCDEDFYKQRLEFIFPGASEFRDPSHTYREFYKILYNIMFKAAETLKSIKVSEKPRRGRPPKQGGSNMLFPSHHHYSEETRIKKLLTIYGEQGYLDVVWYFYALGKQERTVYLPEVTKNISPELLQFIINNTEREDAESAFWGVVMATASELISSSNDKDEIDRILKLMDIYFKNDYYISDARVIHDVMDYGSSKAKSWMKKHYDRQTGNPKNK